MFINQVVIAEHISLEKAEAHCERLKKQDRLPIQIPEEIIDGKAIRGSGLSY